MEKIISFILFVFIYTNVFPQEVKEQGNLVFLFAYSPKEFKEVEFEAGYKKHLEWHKAKKDELAWYGWYTITGSRLGTFIDGSFGISGEEFDKRVDPNGDRKDFSNTTAPFVKTVFRKVFNLKKEMSTIFLLENQNPSKQIDVYEISIQPGKEDVFENIFKKISDKSRLDKDGIKFTLYELILGGQESSYLLMKPRDNFSYFDSHSSSTTIRKLIEKYLPEEQTKFLKDLSNCIIEISSETWLYRKDLSFFPEKP